MNPSEHTVNSFWLDTEKEDGHDMEEEDMERKGMSEDNSNKDFKVKENEENTNIVYYYKEETEENRA